MLKLLKAEYYKLPVISIFGLVIISIVIAELTATGIFYYNIHYSNVVPTVNRFLIYSISWFTPVFFVIFGVLTSHILSTEYENNMWSVLLVSEHNKNKVIFMKYIVAFVITIITLLIFAIVHLFFSWFVVGVIPNPIAYLYILFGFFLGSLAMQSIQFFLGLIIPNKVYIISIGIIIAFLYLLLQSNWLPFKIPEYLIRSKEILRTDQINMFEKNFVIYTLYSFFTFIFVSSLTYVYTNRKDF